MHAITRGTVPPVWAVLNSLESNLMVLIPLLLAAAMYFFTPTPAPDAPPAPVSITGQANGPTQLP